MIKTSLKNKFWAKNIYFPLIGVFIVLGRYNSEFKARQL